MRAPQLFSKDKKDEAAPAVNAPIIITITVVLTALGLCSAVLASLRAPITGRLWTWGLPAALLLAFGLAVLVHGRSLASARRKFDATAGALESVDHEYKLIFENALDAILVLDGQGACLDANPAALLLLGRDRNHVIGRPFANFAAPGTEFVDLAGEQRESCATRGDGSRRWVEYTVAPDFLPGRHIAILRDVTFRKEAESALLASESRFREMAENIREVFWMFDARARKLLYINPACEKILGCSQRFLQQNERAWEHLLHPEDRERILRSVRQSAAGAGCAEEFRILRAGTELRWVSLHAFPVRSRGENLGRVVGTIQDVTDRRLAQEEVARQLARAEAARAEAEALHAATLALTENLSLDCVLDALLQSLRKLVPCEVAQVILVETGTRLFLAREVAEYAAGTVPAAPSAFDARESRLFLRVLTAQEPLLISDTNSEMDWTGLSGFSHLRCWMGVPLVLANHVIGFLSMGGTRPGVFDPEHLRLAASLAHAAAAGIENARLFERAEIYGAELEQRVADLEAAQEALHASEQHLSLSEGRFASFLHTSPVPVWISTLEGGCFLEVNEAFAKHYGYAREELIGRRGDETGIWTSAKEFHEVVEEIHRTGHVHDRNVHLRRSDGQEFNAKIFAQTAIFNGQQCFLCFAEGTTPALPAA